MKEVRYWVFAAVVAVAVLGVGSPQALAQDANGNHESYIWIVGATTPADTAVAPDGSTITLKGRGFLMAGPGGTATGGGVFRRSDGRSGTWIVTGVLEFVSYGPAGPAFPPGFTGGEAKLNVSLSDDTSGVLTVICVLGSPPPSKVEGITVILGPEGAFIQPEGGNTVFILVF